MTGRRTLRGRIGGWASHWSGRIASHKILLGLVVAAIGGFLAYIAWISVNGPPFQDRYKLEAIVAGDSPVLKPGGQVREAGKLAGTITDVSPEGQDLRVSMELRPEFAPVGEDATARVRVRSIVYLTYVEIDPGNRDDPMPDGSTIPLARTSSGVDLLEVVQLFDRKTREELRRSLVNTGEGLAGRGQGLNQSLADVDEMLAAGTPELQALTETPGALSGAIAGAARTSSGLTGNRPDDVASLISSGNDLLGAVAAQDSELGQSIELLRPFEDQLLATAPPANSLLRDASGLARSLQRPTAKLVAGLPQLNALLGVGDPLRLETGRLGHLIVPPLQLAAPQLYELYTTAAGLEPLRRPLSAVSAQLSPYTDEISAASRGVVSATRVKYPQGQTAPNNSALRFIPVLSCHHARDPYPEPGESVHQEALC